AFAVLDGNRQQLAGLAPGRERGGDSLHAERDVTTDERERRVRSEHAGQQAGLAEDLKAVADPEHRSAVGGELRDRSHDRREAGNRTAAEVVAVGKAAR